MFLLEVSRSVLLASQSASEGARGVRRRAVRKSFYQVLRARGAKKPGVGLRRLACGQFRDYLKPMAELQSYRAHTRAVLALGLPLAGSHLAQFSIGVMDTLMLGWYDVEALAAVVLASGVFFTLFILGAGFGFAVMPIVANAHERTDPVEIRRVTRMALWLSAIYALLCIPILMFGEPILVLMGQEPMIAKLAGQYLRIVAFAMLPALGVAVIKSYLGGLERTQFVLWSTVIAAALNGFLNYALIFGNWGAPELGIRGAAIASLIMQSANLVILSLYAVWAEPKHRLFNRIWRADWQAFGRVLRMGFPIGATAVAEVGLFVAAAVLIGWIGTIELAAHGIALQIASATFLVQLGLANAATIRAGRAQGRHDPVGLRRGAYTVSAISFIFVGLSVALFLAVPELLIAGFIDPQDPVRAQVIAVGVSLLAVAALFQIVDAGQVIALGLLRGLQDTGVPMIYAVVSYWVIGLPASYLLGFPAELGAIGVWLGLTIGLAVAWVLMGLRFWRNKVFLPKQSAP
ncbi:MAG: MATE family multidrug resistance protein [Halocynthiibacter sp.]|jgi:MATE family multidrug resistance protein